jgi:hypothetical protein
MLRRNGNSRRGSHPALLALLLMVGLLAGCGGGNPSGLPDEGAVATPKPVAPLGWKVYTNLTYHYSIEYPANWFPTDTSPSAPYLEIYNFDTSQVESADQIPPPPYNKYSIDAFANPNGLAMPAFFALYRETDSTSPPASSQTQRPATVAGRQALEVIQQPVQWANGKIDYPGVTYFVPDGASVLIIGELHSTDGQPSAIFAHMIASLRITK